MYPGHAINSKSLHMCVITVQRKSFVQKTNIFTVQSMLMQLSHEDEAKADKGVRISDEKKSEMDRTDYQTC